MKKLLLTLLSALVFFPAISQAQNIEELAMKSLEAMKNVKTLTYSFYSQERFKGDKFENSEVHFKIQMKPFMIYADAIKPDKAQLIYEGTNPDKVRVKKGPLRLTPSVTSGLLMKQQHHPIYRAGFGTMYKTLSREMKAREGKNLSEFIQDKGSITYDGKDCYHAVLIDPDYKIINYTVKAGQATLWQIGDAMGIPEYRIRELNNLSSDDVKTGQVLKIPSAYAKKTTLYIDKKTMLPIYQKLEDDQGLYEVYEFKNLKLNPTLTEADFTFK
jgi:outer membrane lipoprotein-sorting protein